MKITTLNFAYCLTFLGFSYFPNTPCGYKWNGETVLNNSNIYIKDT